MSHPPSMGEALIYPRCDQTDTDRESSDKRVPLYHIGTFDRGSSNISYSLKDNGKPAPLEKGVDVS